MNPSSINIVFWSVYYMQVRYLLTGTNQISGNVFADYHPGFLSNHYLTCSTAVTDVMDREKL